MLKKRTACMLCVAMMMAGCGMQGGDAGPQATGSAEGPAAADVTESSAVEAVLAESSEAEPEEATPVYSQWIWELDEPENHGMDGDMLRAMHAALEDTEIYSAVTVKDGVIVDEFYQEGYDADSVFRMNSCSKSFTSALIGIAIDEGLIEGVDVPISAYFPEVVGTDKESITIRHLLEHTSGIEWYEFGSSATSFFELNSAENWVEYVLAQPMAATPGSTFIYSTGGTHLLAAILEQATEESLLEYATSHLFAPLGMESVHWRADPQDILDGGNGIEMTSRDAAKFGQLFLQGGNHDGRQLVPAEWVAASTGVQVARSGNYGSYGYQWWIRQFGSANYGAFYAMGAMGQFILVVPELDLVTVFASSMSGDTTGPYPYIENYILAAYGEETVSPSSELEN